MQILFNFFFTYPFPVSNHPCNHWVDSKFPADSIKICLFCQNHPFLHVISVLIFLFFLLLYILYHTYTMIQIKKRLLLNSLFLNFYFFFSFVLITYQSAPVMHTEEYPPHTIPTISGIANSRTEETPSTNRKNTMIKVVREV